MRAAQENVIAAERAALVGQALFDAQQAFKRRYPKSYAAYQSAKTALPGGSTRTVLVMNPFPLIITRGVGSRLYDLDGYEYINVLSEYTAGLFGAGHPHIKEAVKNALEDGMNFGAHGANEARFASLLRQFLPNCERFRFTSSGSEANTLAVAAGLAHTKRKRVLVFDGGYHAGALSFSTQKASLNLPHDYIVASYNDVERTREQIRDAGDTLGVVIVEPMLGSGGAIAGTSEFFSMLRKETTASGAVLLFDEVQTSRLGVGGHQAYLGVVPDLTTVGKYLAGGMPFGAVGGRFEIMDRFNWERSDAWAHPGTFNNHTLTMASGVAALELLLNSDILDDLNRRGEALRERLNVLGRKAGIGLFATGLGSILTIHWSSDPVRTVMDVRNVDMRLRELFHLYLLENGIWAARRGLVALNIDVSDADLEKVEGAVDGFMQRYASVLPRRN